MDSFLASSVVDGLYQLSESQRTICCTIHQPSIGVFQRFDKLLLLSDGHPLYFGPVSNCRKHFESFGFFINYPNPAEYVLSVATMLSSQSKVPTNEQTNNVQVEQMNLLQYSELYLDSLPKVDRDLLTNPLLQQQQSQMVDQQTKIKQFWDEMRSTFSIIAILLKREILGIIRRPFWIAVVLRTALIGIFLGKFNLLFKC